MNYVWIKTVCANKQRIIISEHADQVIQSYVLHRYTHTACDRTFVPSWVYAMTLHSEECRFGSVPDVLIV